MKIMNNKLRFSLPNSILKYNEIEKRDGPRLSDPLDYLKEHAAFWWSIFYPTLLVILCVSLSIGISKYYELFVFSWAGPYPLSFMVCHMIVKFLICAFVRCILKCQDGYQMVRLSFQDSIISVASPVVASALSIGFLYGAIRLTTSSLYHMTTSSVIVFSLVLTIVLKLEKKSWLLVGTVFLIFGGQVAYNYEPTEIHSLGFILTLAGSCAISFRWTMSQRLMQHSKYGLSSPIDVMYYMQPWMLLFLIPVAFSFEGFRIHNQISARESPLVSDLSVYIRITVIVFSGVLAFCLDLMELTILSRTSTLTLCIAGVLTSISRSCLMSGCSYLMSNANFLGVQTCAAGIVIYAIIKLWTSGEEEIEEIDTVSKSVDAKKESVSDQTRVSLIG